MVAEDTLFKLITALESVSTTLSAMSRVMESQREAVSANDLDLLLTTTNQQEELTARLVRCERHRQKAQTVVEQELQVQGVRAIVAALPDSLQPRSRLAELADEMGSKVHDLQRQNHRSSELLTSAIDQARRTRSFLLRLNGSTPTYSAPVLTTP